LGLRRRLCDGLGFVSVDPFGGACYHFRCAMTNADDYMSRAAAEGSGGGVD
jgi:hypothetical protein